MSDLKNINDELKEFAPDLSRMEKKEGYQVPPRYFDRLGDEVMHRIKVEEAEQAQQRNVSWIDNMLSVLQNLMQPKLAVGLAAAVLLIIGFQQFVTDTSRVSVSPSFSSLTDEEVENYLAENIYDFEEELLEGLATEMNYIPETIGDEELDDYFQYINEDLDSSTLEELLL